VAIATGLFFVRGSAIDGGPPQSPMAEPRGRAPWSDRRAKPPWQSHHGVIAEQSPMAEPL